MGNPCHPRSASQLHHKAFENKLWGRKCGDSIEIIFAQSCLLIGWERCFVLRKCSNDAECHPFHHPPVIWVYDLICNSDRLSASFLPYLIHTQLVAGAIPSTSFDWSAVCRGSRTVHLSLRNSTWCTSVKLFCYKLTIHLVFSLVTRSRVETVHSHTLYITFVRILIHRYG